MTHPLLDPAKNIYMPTPKSSHDEGEAWIVADYFMLVQRHPEPIYRSVGGEFTPPIEIDHRTALSAFYRLDRNPHGPSARPIAVYSVERFVMPGESTSQPSAGGHADESNAKKQDYMLCMYYADKHANYGICRGDGSKQSDRDQLIQRFLLDFGLSDRPKLIGCIADIEGHPETGVPASTFKLPAQRKGCLPVFLVLLVGLLAATLIRS